MRIFASLARLMTAEIANLARSCNFKSYLNCQDQEESYIFHSCLLYAIQMGY